MEGVIFVFGASCSGKSTLAQALQENLSWHRIDRDDLVQGGASTEDNANQVLDQKISELKTRIIIDAQIPWRKKQEGEFYFLVHPSLEACLERDGRRNQRLDRPPQQAQRARAYVIRTHKELSKLPRDLFDDCFDSSALSVEQEVEKVSERCFQKLVS